MGINNTIHKPTLKAAERIKALKNKLAKEMFKYYLSLDKLDKEYVEIMMEDPDIIDDEQSHPIVV